MEHQAERRAANVMKHALVKINLIKCFYFLYRDKIIELEKLYTVNMSEQTKTATKERIQRLFNEDPVKQIHLGDMTNKLSQQESKLAKIKQHI
jgi:hypothetical protein